MIVRPRIQTVFTLLLCAMLAGACSGGSSSDSGGSGSTGQQPTPSGGGTTPPSVASMQPDSGVASASISTVIAIAFTEPLDASGINQQSLQLLDAGVPVPGMVTYDSDAMRLSFTPDAALATDTVYEVVVSTSLQDVDGNSFPGHGWFFTTGGAYNLGNTDQMTIDMCMDQSDLQMLTLVNDARAVSRSCGADFADAQPALSWDCLLDQAAVGHSVSMATNDFHAHVSPVDGSDPGDRITAVGYSPQAWGENIAAGYADEASVVTAWLDSPGHCLNIMSGSFTEMGAGYAENPASTYGIYWTQNFGRPL